MSSEFVTRLVDSGLLNLLARVDNPSSYEKVILGTLFMRYQEDLEVRPLLDSVIQHWELTPKELYRQCKALWQDGFRPTDQTISGSSWDLSSNE